MSTVVISNGSYGTTACSETSEPQSAQLQTSEWRLAE